MKTLSKKIEQINARKTAILDIASVLGWVLVNEESRSLRFLVKFATVDESMERARDMSQEFGILVSVVC